MRASLSLFLSLSISFSLFFPASVTLLTGFLPIFISLSPDQSVRIHRAGRDDRALKYVAPAAPRTLASHRSSFLASKRPEFRRVEGTSPLTISCRAARQRAINFSEFYDSPHQRYARFTAKVEESFARSLARAQESFVRPFVCPFARSLAAKSATGSTAGGCGVPATAGIDMHCPRLSSPCFPTLPRGVRSRCPRAFRPRSPSAASFSPRRLSAVRTTPMRQRFYLIALLCFIEQLLR